MKEKIKKVLISVRNNNIVRIMIHAISLNLIVEMLSRRSLFEGISFMYSSFGYFLWNTMIIAIPLFFSLLFKRKIFIQVVLTLFWLICGFTNCIVLGFRAMPFSATDILMIKSTISLVDVYFTKGQIVLIILGILFVIGLLIFLWIKLPITELKKKEIIISGAIGSMTLAVVLLISLSTEAKNISTEDSNIAYQYRDYGFAYCFSNSMINIGISKPVDYSQETVSQMVLKLDIEQEESTNQSEVSTKDNKSVLEDKPNVIYVQLESFNDPAYIGTASVSQNPLPVFTKLKEDFTSGTFTVPVVGGGTANTEFEVLTSMSTEFFGTGEIPYTTILDNKTCDSMAYNLRANGYNASALHDNDASFYGRNQVYANLGFNRFVPLEYMYNVEYNSKGWAKDNILISNITDCMKESQERDFIFTVSVQGHGKYPTDTVVDDNFKVGIEGGTQEEINEFDYYISQINEMDQFIANLISSIETINEPTIIVFYGDHQPALSYDETDLDGISLYETEYVIWNNMNLEVDDENLAAYQLSSKINDILGINGGIMEQYQGLEKDNSTYLQGMQMLQYDMLYGKNYLFEENNPFMVADMKFGIKDIVIENVYTEESNIEQENSDTSEIVISGQGYNEFSQVEINGKLEDTEYVDFYTLKVLNKKVDIGDIITVAQVGEDGKVVGTTSDFLYGSK